jgi:hypothetical protein
MGLGDMVTEKSFSSQMVRRRGDEIRFVDHIVRRKVNRSERGG